MHPTLHDPSLTIALALVAGTIAQALARHLKMPGIVVLLAAGVLLGPDALGWIQPDDLGRALEMLVGFAVAIILFEGGLNLNLARLRREATSIRRLVTWGALLTALGGAAAAHWILRWDWRLSLLFGSLVIVTGPTVVTPLIHRIRLRPRVATILEAEGVLIDPIGAIFAIVTLEFVLYPSALRVGAGLLDLVQRLGGGVLFGALAGLGLAALLRFRRLVPEGLENILALSWALVLYQLSNALLPESGIMAVTIAGLIVGGTRSHALRELREFKGQLTTLFIGMLFVLLAASVRLDEVRELGLPGLLAVAALMWVVRPIQVAICTAGTDVTWKERAFVSWLAPRGIVAAAVASLFATVLTANDIPGGRAFQAMIFLVIAVTVLFQGLTSGWIAAWLGLRRPSDNGYVILGAGPLARELGDLLKRAGEEAVLIDTNLEACELARERGLDTIYGSGTTESALLRADFESRAGVVALTTNEEANLLFVESARTLHGAPRAWVALRKGHMRLRRDQILSRGAHILFGEPRQIDRWDTLIERDEAEIEMRVSEADSVESADAQAPEPGSSSWPSSALPLVVHRNGKARLVDETYEARRGDRIVFLVQRSNAASASDDLRQRGWAPVFEHDAGANDTRSPTDLSGEKDEPQFGRQA